eukprot:scaffold117093_cov14-Prasinocladus_malaysianus.AAC.1
MEMRIFMARGLHVLHKARTSLGTTFHFPPLMRRSQTFKRDEAVAVPIHTGEKGVQSSLSLNSEGISSACI